MGLRALGALSLALLACSGAPRGEGALAPVRVALAPRPAETRVGEWLVRVTDSRRDARPRGSRSSRGPLLRFEVVRIAHRRLSFVFDARALRAEAIPAPPAPPRLVLWSQAGPPSWMRCEYEQRSEAYCLVACRKHVQVEAGVFEPSGPLQPSPSCSGAGPLDP